MASVPPEKLEGQAAWAAAWIDDARAALPDAPAHERPACAARLAAMLVACGRDEEADAVLSQARREAARSSDAHAMMIIEIALAATAVTRDNGARANGHLAAARRQMSALPPSAIARAWMVESRLARIEGRASPKLELDDPDGTQEDMLDPDERVDLAAELALERAALARTMRDFVAARALVDRMRGFAEVAGSPRLAAMAELEDSWIHAENADVPGAVLRLRRAIDQLAADGLAREHGRAMLRLAEILTANPTYDDGVGSAALWLGRAQATLSSVATWRDRSAIRNGFRAHGRRLFDRVMNEGTAVRIEAFERARGALLSAISLSVEAAECSLNDLEAQIARDPASGDALPSLLENARTAALSTSIATAPAVADMDRAMHDLVDLVGAALVERDRLRSLLNVLSDIDAVTERDALPPLVAHLAARVLEADHVVVALGQQGQLEPAGTFGAPPPGSAELWRTAGAASTASTRMKATSDVPMAGRADAQPAGPVLVVPLRAGDVDGVLYADKLTRNAQFREQDHALAFLLAEYAAITLGRLRARDQERSALSRLAITLDAIRDGVIAWDESGVVLSTNVALERMLRVGHGELVGQKVDQIAVLAPVASLVAMNQRLDGAVVRLTPGSFVASTRPLEAIDDTSGRGMVVTLVELDRAQRIAQRISAARPRYGFHDVIGTSSALQAAISVAKQAATTDANLLILGESGTGKEVLAQAIHTAGARATEPFVGLNVAAVPRDLLEAELFGYERGAFTGARSDGNLGKFELAGGGTILLDEIGEMPIDMQAKLLRVLQERVVVRLAGSTERPFHARVMATTHRDLQELVDEGKFRMDLLFRLRVLAIELPPLRDRAEDIALLAQHYLSRFAEQQRKRVREIGPRVIDELERYDWPGNVRELANVMEAEVSMLAPDATALDRLATRLVGRFRGFNASSTGEFRVVAAPSTPSMLSPEAPIVPLADLEKRAFLHALDRCHQNVARASEALGVSKVTFYAKLRAWGMHPRDRFDGEESPTSVRRQRAADPFDPPTGRSARMQVARPVSGEGPTPEGEGGSDK